MKILYIPTDNEFVLKIFRDHSISFEQIDNFNYYENSPELISPNSVLIMDIQGLNSYLDNFYFWSNFFKKKCKLIVNSGEVYELVCDLGIGGKHLEFLKKIKKYYEFSDQIYVLSNSSINSTKYNKNFRFWSLTDLEFPEIFLKYKHQPKLDRKFDVCMLNNSKKTRLERVKFTKFLESNRPDIFNSKSNYISDDEKTKIREKLSESKNFHRKFYDCWPQENSYFEFVLETNQSANATVLSEKICKTLVACTPFIALGDPDFYNCLHRLGFQTFGEIIDESWHKLDNGVHKFNLILTEFEKIEKLGFKQFYSRCWDITRHNYNHMAYVASKQLRLREKRFLHLLSMLSQD